MNRKLFYFGWYMLLTCTTFAFSRQDTLRGGNGNGRKWWDVLHYELSVSFDIQTQSIQGANQITAKIISSPHDSLQLDLKELMFLDSVCMHNTKLHIVKEGNVWWVIHPFSEMPDSTIFTLTAYYHGKPKTAAMPPWDGGFIWTTDSPHNPWIAVACQGTGASLWWPCKDYQGDEPDLGVDLHFYIPEGLYCVSNGQLTGIHPPGKHVHNFLHQADGTEYSYKVKNPINNYNVSFYIGDYVHWEENLEGLNGRLPIRYYALRYNEAKARKHFQMVPQMLHCFESWLGPYPFYEDGYSLVEAPYLGMEHQSAVAYGNNYQQGYKGTDRSATGVGMLFDHLIVHESGHEWFGNSITAHDMADNWIHEGFTSYSEVLYIECISGKENAYTYSLGTRRNIRNDKPVRGIAGIHQGGSVDQYDKGAAIVHMIRIILNDDSRFRSLLQELNQHFRHRIISSDSLEAYIIQHTGYPFEKFFEQYLHTTQIPVLEWYVKDKKLFYRFKHAVEGFSLPIAIKGGAKENALIHPTTQWQHIKWKSGFDVSFPEDFLIKIE
jgi:aminopeptidase N